MSERNLRRKPSSMDKGSTPSRDHNSAVVRKGTSPRITRGPSSVSLKSPSASNSPIKTAIARDIEDAFQEFSVVQSVASLGDSTNSPVAALDDDAIAPIIPLSRLPFALARLRLHFSESELAAEIALSSSRAGLNRDEFTRFVQSNINSRVSLEQAIAGFVALQPSGVMGIEELRAFVISDALRLENDVYGERDSEPLSADEFDIFRGHVDPRGEGTVPLSRFIAWLFPNTSPELVENLLEKHGVGATHRAEEREEKMRLEDEGRMAVDAWEAEQRKALVATFAAAIDAYMEPLRRKAQQERDDAELRRQQLMAQREQKCKEERVALLQRETEGRLAIENTHEVKERKKIADAQLESKNRITNPPRQEKVDFGCCRIIPDK